MRCNQWPHLRLGAVASVKGGKRLPKGELLKTEATPHPYIRVRDIGPNRRLSVNDGFEYVSRAVQQQIQRYTVRAGDVIISIVGSIGLLAVIDLSLDGANLTENCAKIVDLDSVDGDFLYYYLSSDLGQDEIRKRTVGAVQAKLPLKNIADIPIPCPPLPEQRAIAAMLSCLDDKIELNNRMNKTLEEMAQALFKSWFVDFDPVKAKMEGREPTGMDAETAALFPDEFEDSELGPIPKGWRVDTLGSVVSVNAQSLSKDFPHEMIYYVDINSVSEGSCTWPELAPLHTAPSRARRLVRDGDTIWSMVRPNRRAFLYVCEPDERVVVSTGFAVLSPELVPSSFLHSHVTMSEFSDYLASNADGSAYPAVRPGHFEGARLVLPTDSVLSSFDMLVGPIRRRIHRNQQENANLSSLRDTLLPKLMSGEIRVPEAEDILEEVL